MDYLYLLLNLGSISIPFLYSFHPKLKFYKFWKPLFLAMIVTMLVFIPWDIIFTKMGIWGFNNSYYLDYKIAGLPLEEWLFFVCIPYACVFTHYALLFYYPKMALSRRKTFVISLVLIVLLLLLASISIYKWYTVVNFAFATIVIFLVMKYNFKLLQQFYLTYLVMLIPFFIVNGILTGSFIENEVVWYNNNENLGIRLFTIPIEDTIYGFSLILMTIALTHFFKRKLQRK